MRYKLWQIFLEIQKDTDYYVSSSKGKDFENRFKQTLETEQYNNITQKPKTNSAIKQIAIIEKINIKITTEKFYRNCE